MKAVLSPVPCLVQWAVTKGTIVIVYVVTSGAYSDYRIKRVFSTRDTADAYIEPRTRPGLHEDYWQVQEWAVDEAPVNDRPVYTASFDIPGSVTGRPFVRWDDYDQDKEYGVTVEPLEGGRFWIRVYAESPEKATKIIHDKVAEIRAHQAGVV